MSSRKSNRLTVKELIIIAIITSIYTLAIYNSNLKKPEGVYIMKPWTVIYKNSIGEYKALNIELKFLKGEDCLETAKRELPKRVGSSFVKIICIIPGIHAQNTRFSTN